MIRRLALPLAFALLAAGGCRTVTAHDPAPREPVFDPDAPPPIPPGIDRAHLHFTRSQVQVGGAAPDFTLPRTDGTGDLTLSALRGRPVVLVFGSFT